MSTVSELFNSNLHIVNMGLDSFADDMEKQGVPVVRVTWKPPAGGDAKLIDTMDKTAARLGSKIREANIEASSRILNAKPAVMGIGKALQTVPGMKKNLILHAGPPVTWDRMCGPMRGAVIGGILYEGMAADAPEAEKLAASGEILFEPCHHHDAVGPMAGVMTASMPVWILENQTEGNRAYCTLNEGLGKVLRYGAFSPDVIERLKWMADTLAPALQKAIDNTGPIDMKGLIAQVLQMGDEGHNRNRAGTSLFLREVAPALVRSGLDTDTVASVLEFIIGNDHFFLNMSMPACKCSVDAAREIEYSSVITAMARNGTDFGIRISGLGDEWFTAPASKVDGLYLPGFTEEDAALDIGDSVITETAGIGGFAMAAAPAIVKFIGGVPADAVEFTTSMYEITVAENNAYQIPAMNFRGTPTGIDVLRVAETGILPAINTGIAHREPGIGMVGAGLVKPPSEVFREAAATFCETYLAKEKT